MANSNTQRQMWSLKGMGTSLDGIQLITYEEEGKIKFLVFGSYNNPNIYSLDIKTSKLII